jgi:membrane fusion protein, multidrug efflux system
MNNDTQPITQPTPPSKRRSRLVPALVAALAVVGGIVVYSTMRATSASSQPAAPASADPKVTVAPVEVESLSDYDEITGHVDATETVELRARVSGHLDEVHFQAGQIVQAGDILFTIDPRWYKAQFDLATAKAEDAAREAKRADELLAAAAISNEEAETRRALAAEAQAELAVARLDWEHTQVRAPITGRIGRALITKGNLVSGSPGDATLLATIVSVGQAYVYADMDEETFLKFSRFARDHHVAGETSRIPVDLELADETDYPRHGFVESTDNQMNPDTGSLTVRMVFPNADDALVPGLYARVRIPIGTPQPTVLVSERAVETDQSQKFVLVVGGDRVASYRTVTLGGAVEGRRIVRSGLRPGDRVIVDGLQHVRPGMAVDPEVASALPHSPTAELAAAP